MEIEGTTIKHYAIEKNIGKGQFSTVYKGKNVSNNTAVAIKKVPIFEMMDEKSRNDCIKEIDLLKSLDHVNVVRCFEAFVESGELIIVIELADAGDLSKMIKHFKSQDRLIPERTVWKYFSQIAAGLQHMHKRRVMHRDIKPANVFVTEQGVVKLGDLGLGRFFNESTAEAHSLVGTPYYMSPERMQEIGYSFKSDIWSLGCLLYELAVLQSPFYGEKMTIVSLCDKIAKCDYPPIPKGNYSADLSKLVSSMISLNPDLRPDIDEVYEISKTMYEKFKKEDACAK